MRLFFNFNEYKNVAVCSMNMNTKLLFCLEKGVCVFFFIGAIALVFVRWHCALFFLKRHIDNVNVITDKK